MTAGLWGDSGLAKVQAGQEHEGAAPVASDPQIATIATLLGFLGFEIGDQGKDIIGAVRELGAAIFLEMLAGLGPMILSFVFLPAPPEPKPGRVPRSIQLQGAPAELPAEEDHVPPFVSECLDARAGAWVAAGDVRRAYEDWCEATDREPINSTAFGRRLAQLVPKDRNNNRPRYTGVMLRGAIAKPATLRVAVDNTNTGARRALGEMVTARRSESA